MGKEVGVLRCQSKKKTKFLVARRNIQEMCQFVSLRKKNKYKQENEIRKQKRKRKGEEERGEEGEEGKKKK